MTIKTPNKEKYLALILDCQKAINAYYNQTPTMTDAEYDSILSEVKAFEKANPADISPDSPTQNVGSSVRASAFGKKKHIKKMYSIEDMFPYTDEGKKELNGWLERFSKDEKFYIEPKYDGASLSLIYQDGKIAYAITRGDGKIGEDISANIPYINGIPLNISANEKTEIRGEVVILEKDFEKINEYRVENGKEPFSNRRNASSGGLRSLESEQVKAYRLHFIPYSLGENELDFEKQTDEVQWFKDMGFEYHGTDMHQAILSADEVLKAYENMQTNRGNYQTLLDGAVIKVNNKHAQEEVGETNHHPRWACALKFMPEEKTTTILNIITQVGKTGAITPVAEIEPTEIGGVIVSRVTLHNYDDMERKDIRIGDKAVLIRSGDVIPKIVKVFSERRVGTEIIPERPTFCPVCGDTGLDTEEVVIKCTNPDCEAKIKGRLKYASGRKALNMMALGESTISTLVDKGYVLNLIDLFEITVEKLLTLDGFKIKKAQKVYDSIQSAKGCEAQKLLNAIDIPELGQSASEKLVETYGLEVFNYLTKAQITAVDEIGDVIADEYENFMASEYFYVQELVAIVNPKVEEKVSLGKALEGKTIVITGTLSKSRGEFKALAEAHGAKVSGSVSKNTSYLLAGDKAGSKATKAESLGVPILNEEAFMALISAV